MSYKILTKNGIDNSNIDGARGEYFNSGMRDGIVQGALNEGLFTATASNIISLDTCELRIAGHRIVIDEPVYHTFTNAPSSDTRYAFVAQIVVDDNQNVDFSLFVQTANTPLIQNDLYKTITGAGTYQVEIGRFTLLTTLTIEDVVRTIDIITGGTGGGSGSEINIGTVTTQTLDSDADAEVDVSSRYEEDEGKEYLDFTFGIPKAEVNVDTELSTTSENAVQNKAITNALNEKLGNNGEQILNGTLEVTTETFDEPGVTVDKSVTVNNSGNNTSKTTTNIAQLNTSGLAVGQIEETTTSSGSDTVAKEVLYGLSDIKVNGSSIIGFTDGDVAVNGNLTSLSTEATPVNYIAVSKEYTIEGPSATRDINVNSKISPSIIDLSVEGTLTNSSGTTITANAVRIDPSSMRISGNPFSFSIKNTDDDSYSSAALISTNGVFNFYESPTVSVGDGTSEDLMRASQVVRTDSPQALNRKQYENFILNSTPRVFTSLQTSEPTWKTVGKLNNYGLVRMTVATTINGADYTEAEFILSVSYMERASITQIGNSEGSLISAIRLRGDSSANMFIDLQVSNPNPSPPFIAVWFDVRRNNSSGYFETVDFETFSGNDGDYAITTLSLDKKGINTTGGVYQNGSPVLVGAPPTWVTGTSGSLTLPGAGWYILYGNYSYTGIVWWSPQDPNGEQVTTGYIALNNNIAISTSGVVSLLNAPSGVTVYYYKIG